MSERLQNERLRIGLVGAGPWAQLFTGPMLQAADADFVGVWARRAEAAQTVAAAHDTRAFDDLDALFDACEAVCFSVPPDVQADLAGRAAARGLAVLLDKPIGATVDQAERLVGAIDDAGVPSMVILTNRYFDVTRRFLADAASFEAYGGRASFFGNGCVPGTFFGTPWRVDSGGLLDLGPHVLDALDAALGTIVDISARGNAHGLVLLECEHDTGAVSQAAISATTDQAGWLDVELHGPAGQLHLDIGSADIGAEYAAAQRRIVDELTEYVRTGTRHTLDAHRGLHLQRLIATATTALAH